MISGDDPTEFDGDRDLDVDVERGKALRFSRRFDVHKWSDHPEVNDFVDVIFVDHFKKGNGRIQRKHVKVVLLDLYVAWCEDENMKISFSRNNNDYQANSIYNELHISRVTIAVIDKL